MEPLASSAALGVVVFAATNVDDVFILAAFFADPTLARRSIVVGQFVGIGMLVLAGAAAALVACTFSRALRCCSIERREHYSVGCDLRKP